MSKVPCAVESALNRHYKTISKAEDAETAFERDIKDELESIRKAVSSIQSVMRGYELDGFDMSDFAKESIMESVGVL